MFRILALSIVAIFAAFQMAAQTRANETVSVLSYNIRYQNNQDGEDHWQNRKQTVITTIRQADLIGLQEVVGKQFDDVREGTPEWSWYGVGRDDGLAKGEIVPVGWRSDQFITLEQGTFWLSDSPYSIGEKGWDAAISRTATWVRLVPRKPSARANRSRPTNRADGEPEPSANADAASNHRSEPTTLLIVNTHFDHRGGEARVQSARMLREWIAKNRGSSEVIMLGDLNSGPESEPLNQLLIASKSEFAPLADTRALSPVADPGPDGTWNGFKEIQIGTRIDFILYQGDRLKVVHFETLDPRTPAGRFGSDHLPILSRFETEW